MTGTPLVTVLVPMRNEARHIEACLRHIVDQDAADKDAGDLDTGDGPTGAAAMEIIVVDGNSTDDSAQIAKAFLAEHHHGPWNVLHNPLGATPANLNVGLRAANGRYLCRVDARSLIPANYVRTCVAILEEHPEVTVTGGRQLAIPPSATAVGAGIGRALNNRYTMGMSRYRRGAGSGPTDTVYLGSFRTSELRGAGGWNEEFATNQDFELNRRMSQTGTIWFDDSIPVQYIPRDNISDLWRQYRRFGRWKVHYWNTTGDRPQARQALLIAAPPLAALAWLLGLAVTRRGWRLTWAAAPLLAAVTVDELGSAERHPPPTTRLTATAASAAVALGWWSGVVEGVLRKRPD